jgi:hypothetical protein
MADRVHGDMRDDDRVYPLTVTGLVLVLANANTTVDQEVAGQAGKGPSPWSQAVAAPRGLPPAVGVPLFFGRF